MRVSYFIQEMIEMVNDVDMMLQTHSGDLDIRHL